VFYLTENSLGAAHHCLRSPKPPERWFQWLRVLKFISLLISFRGLEAKLSRRALVSFWLLLLLTPGAFYASADVPTLQVRLETHLTSYASPRGSPFRCVVLRPFDMDGQVVIPEKSVVYGTVSRELPVGFGVVRERAGLELSFNEYETPDGLRFPLDAKLVSIDNAREQVTPEGRIRGILAASNPNQFIFGVWQRPSLNLVYRSLVGLTGASNQIWAKYSMGAIGAGALLAVRCFVFRFPEPEIHLPPGTDMTLTVSMSRPANLSTRVDTQPSVPPETLPRALADQLEREPYRIERPNGRYAGDVINLAFIGSREELVNAFSAAGWSVAEPYTLRSASRVFGAFNTMRNYAAAPVSTLLYEKHEPDLVFEKSLNTIAKRHHVRIWRSESFDGQDIWLAAATHDTGIALNLHLLPLTHRIDPEIDLEREKVSTDISFAGCSQDVDYVDRPAASFSRQKPAVITDGALAVVPLTACSHPYMLDDDDPAPKGPGTKLTRLARRIVLESRNYLLRDNEYYWGYKLVRHLRPKP
jgi:hypothetical protein